MDHPDYVYTPRPQWVRDKLARIHRQRLGIPDGHVQIYGVHVPEQHAVPLRHWANWVRQRRGWDEAVDFVRQFIANGHTIEKPSPSYRIAEGPRSDEVRRRISEGVKRQFASLESTRFDWELVGELFSEGMTIPDIAEHLRVGEQYLSRTLKNRRRVLKGERWDRHE